MKLKTFVVGFHLLLSLNDCGIYVKMAKPIYIEYGYNELRLILKFSEIPAKMLCISHFIY